MKRRNKSHFFNDLKLRKMKNDLHNEEKQKGIGIWVPKDSAICLFAQL